MGMKIRMYGGGSGGGEQGNGGNGGGGGAQSSGGSSARMDGGGQSSSMMAVYPVPPHMYGGETSRMMEYPVYSPMTPPHARQMGFVSPDFRGGEEMRHGGRRHSPDEGREGSYSRYEDEGGQGSEWAQKLKMGLKKLERKLDEMLEKIEDESESKRDSKKRHKKDKDGDDDEDDEEDADGPLVVDAILSKAPGIDCLRHIPDIVSAAVEVIGNPPDTWPSYLQKEDYIGLFRMEGNELIQAVEGGKSLHDVDRELTHTTSAMLLLCAQARQQDHD